MSVIVGQAFKPNLIQESKNVMNRISVIFNKQDSARSSANQGLHSCQEMSETKGNGH